MSDSFDRGEFVAGYLIEVEEHLLASNGNLLKIEAALEKNETASRQVRELFRSLHTIKGLSAMVGVEPVVQISHEMETLLRLADQGTPMNASGVALLLEGLHAVEQRVRAFAKKQKVPAAPRKLLEALAGLSSGPAIVVAPGKARLDLQPDLMAKLSAHEQDQLVQGLRAGLHALRIDFVPSPQRTAEGINITSVRERVGRCAEIVKVLPLSVPKTEQAPGGLTFALLVLTSSDAAIVAAAAAAPESVTIIGLEPIDTAVRPGDPAEQFLEEPDEDFSTHGSIRVETARLDDALERLGALVVTRFKLGRALLKLRDQGVDTREVQSILQDHGREIRQLRSAITRARMVSAVQLLERVPLIVRRLNESSADKKVRLIVDAGQGELDKTVADRIFPALIHLVRNAVDHAIESIDERKKLGKPEIGTVTVSCRAHSDTQLEVSVSDDGRGINGDVLARKAQRPVPQDAGALLDLITLPGLSSREEVTDRSGRGMGMEIVKRIADTLGGELTVHTAPARGTTFKLRVPLSISILDAFTFACGPQTFVIPISMVEEIVELRPEDVFAAPSLPSEAPQALGGLGEASKSNVKMLKRRGATIPLFDLSELFELEKAAAQHSQGLPSAIVVKRQDQRFAFAVQRMQGQQEVVIRPLEDPLVKVGFVSGTTDLGDGLPTLVLDLVQLSQTAARRAQDDKAGPRSRERKEPT